MSGCALSQVSVVLVENVSPSRVCRWGSHSTSLQTVDICLAKKSLTALWRMMMYPPLGQFSELFMSILAPQTHERGNRGRSLLYRRRRLSLNSPLFSVKPMV